MAFLHCVAAVGVREAIGVPNCRGEERAWAYVPGKALLGYGHEARSNDPPIGNKQALPVNARHAISSRLLALRATGSPRFIAESSAGSAARHASYSRRTISHFAGGLTRSPTIRPRRAQRFRGDLLKLFWAGPSTATGRPRRVIVMGSPKRSISRKQARHFALNSDALMTRSFMISGFTSSGPKVRRPSAG